MPPMPSPAPTPTPMEIYQAALARMQSASPYAMATPVSSMGAPQAAPNALQQGAQTALQVLAKREIGKALLDKGASAAAPEILSATRLGSSAAPEILSATRLPGAVAPEATSISNFAGAATPYLGAAGAAAGAYGAYQGIKNKNPLAAGMGGAGAALGINAMGYALGPWGWAAMAAAPAIGALVNKYTDKDRWKEEQDAVGKLAKKGITGWQAYANAQPKLTAGRSMEQLVALEAAKKAKGQYSNEDFARTRDEKYLKGKDIWGYSDFGEKFGNDWFGKFSEKQREDISQMALDDKAVQESKAGIKVNWNEGLQKKIDEYLKGAKK